jgi:hypothetical protein
MKGVFVMKKILFLGLTILCIIIHGNAFAYLPGDVNNDGKIDHKESIYAMQVMAGIKSPVEIGSDVKTFFVEGDVNKYYAVVFKDKDWGKGPASFEISRSNTHADGTWHGTMHLIINWHSSNYGHGAHFLEYQYKISANHFAADIHNYIYKPYLFIWLRGQTHYNYRNIKNNVELIKIFGTDNKSCSYDCHTPPTEETTIDCTHRTTISPSIKTGKNITMPVRIESEVDLTGNFNMTGQFNLNGNITSDQDICIGKCDE